VETLYVERSPGVTRKGRADQGVMEGGAGSLRWEGGLFRETGIPFPAIGDEAGNPVPRPYELGCDGVKRKMVRTTMAPTTECVRRPAGPIVPGPKDTSETLAFALLNDDRETVIALAARTGRLKQVFQLRGLHVLGSTSYFRGENLFQFFTLGKGPGRKNSDISSPVVETLGEDHIDRTSRGFLDRDGSKRLYELQFHGSKGRRVSRIDGVLDSQTFKRAFRLEVDPLWDPALVVDRNEQRLQRRLE